MIAGAMVAHQEWAFAVASPTVPGLASAPLLLFHEVVQPMPLLDTPLGGTTFNPLIITLALEPVVYTLLAVLHICEAYRHPKATSSPLQPRLRTGNPPPASLLHLPPALPRPTFA